ncbi:MAG: hypothetical protein U1F53_06770 [Burkholderiaceae bacterium]
MVNRVNSPATWEIVIRSPGELAALAGGRPIRLVIDLGTSTAEAEAPRAMNRPCVEAFWHEWSAGGLPVAFGPARSQALYAAYRRWCSHQAVAQPKSIANFVSQLMTRFGMVKARVRHMRPGAKGAQATIVSPGGLGIDDAEALRSRVASFDQALQAWSARSSRASNRRGHR